jgi:hypothetical protein
MSIVNIPKIVLKILDYCDADAARCFVVAITNCEYRNYYAAYVRNVVNRRSIACVQTKNNFKIRRQ